MKRADSSRAYTRGAKGSAFRALFLSALLLFSHGCASYLVVSGGAADREKLEEIKMGVAALRGLDFKAQVPIEIEDKERMRRHIEADLLREYGEEKLKNMALAYAKLGLLPSGVDLKKSLVDFYGKQVVAFYDPQEKKLFLPEDMGAGFLLGTLQLLARRDIMGEMVLAHELTHALQDQHFSLEERLRPSDNEDRDLAFHAVAEGDATVSGFGYLFGVIDEQSLATIDKSVQNSMEQARAVLADIPEAIVEELLFQYYGGVSFVTRVLEAKGWTGVNLLYRAPPLSTAQILHPEKYFTLPDPPARIELKDLSTLFGPGWREIENNVLGELMTQVLFRRYLTEDEAKKIAAGWDGDRFVAFQNGQEVAFIWASVWDSVQDAEEFLRGYQELLSKKYGAAGEPAGRTYLERRDQRAVVVEGLVRDSVEKQIEKVWQGMELKEQAFRAPFKIP